LHRIARIGQCTRFQAAPAQSRSGGSSETGPPNRELSLENHGAADLIAACAFKGTPRIGPERPACQHVCFGGNSTLPRWRGAPPSVVFTVGWADRAYRQLLRRRSRRPHSWVQFWIAGHGDMRRGKHPTRACKRPACLGAIKQRRRSWAWPRKSRPYLIELDPAAAHCSNPWNCGG